MNRRSGHFADLLDLRATLADEGAALRRGHDQPEGDGRPRHATTALDVVELRAPFLELLAYQRERFEDRVRRPADGHYPLWASSIGDVDLRA